MRFYSRSELGRVDVNGGSRRCNSSIGEEYRVIWNTSLALACSHIVWSRLANVLISSKIVKPSNVVQHCFKQHWSVQEAKVSVSVPRELTDYHPSDLLLFQLFPELLNLLLEGFACKL